MRQWESAGATTYSAATGTGSGTSPSGTFAMAWSASWIRPSTGWRTGACAGPSRPTASPSCWRTTWRCGPRVGWTGIGVILLRVYPPDNPPTISLTCLRCPLSYAGHLRHRLSVPTTNSRLRLTHRHVSAFCRAVPAPSASGRSTRIETRRLSLHDSRPANPWVTRARVWRHFLQPNPLPEHGG